MTRQYVIDNNLVDRYLLGQLSGRECDRFEEYFMDSPETLDELEVTEKLISGFSANRYGQAVTRKSSSSSIAEPVQVSRKTPNLYAIAASVVAAAALAFGFNAQSRLAKQELEYFSGSANTPIVTMQITRGSSATATLRLPETRTPVALAVDIGYAESQRYSVEITGAGGKTLWSSQDLIPDANALLTFSLPPGMLSPGNYQVFAAALIDNPTELRYDLVVE